MLWQSIILLYIIYIASTHQDDGIANATLAAIRGTDNKTTANDDGISSSIHEDYATNISNETIGDPESNGTIDVVVVEEELIPKSGEDDLDIVITENGPVRGYELHGQTGIRSYIDIPYGIIDGIFQAPKPPEPLETVHQVREHTKRCPQPLPDSPDSYVGDLSCLTLSVFTPPNATNAGVLFHIHSGDFSTGSGDPAKYGPEYIVPKGVILVLPNYRLGALGFLCLQTQLAPGNAALKDLNQALNWTKHNIKPFGGDPGNIVVSGVGTGAALAGFLATSPISSYNVDKAIIESGSVFSHWSIDRHPIATARKLEDRFIDNGNITENLFKDIEIATLMIRSRDINFKPCIEKQSDGFIIKPVWKVLQEQILNKTFIIGSASQAGMREALTSTEEILSTLNVDFAEFLPNDLVFQGVDQMTKVAEMVRTQYFGTNNISKAQMEEFSLCHTDVSYLGPGLRFARSLLKADATVYFYEFAYVGDRNRELQTFENPLHGAARGDVIGYLFSTDALDANVNSEDINMSNLITDLWVSFIHTGKPSASNIHWAQLKEVNEDEEDWLLLDSDSQPRKGVHLDRMTLWTEIYDNHFIDRNIAFSWKPGAYLVLSVFILTILM